MLTRLSYCKAGQEVKAVKFCCGKGAIKNINSLNLSIGDTFIISQNDDFKSPIVINLNGEDTLVGKELASKIFVETEVNNEILLSCLRNGDIAEVNNILAQGEIRRRLLDMGLVKGTVLESIRKAPLGDPMVVKINGFELSLRIKEAENILVSLIKLNENMSSSFFHKFSKRGKSSE